MSDKKQKAKEKKAAVLSRYPGQRILIGDSVTVRVVKVEGKRVFVYIEATEDYEIVRPSKEEDAADRSKAGEASSGGAFSDKDKKKS
jgi:sRNA-binding carbon storage regulator CsrA